MLECRDASEVKDETILEQLIDALPDPIRSTNPRAVERLDRWQKTTSKPE